MPPGKKAFLDYRARQDRQRYGTSKITLLAYLPLDVLEMCCRLSQLRRVSLLKLLDLLRDDTVQQLRLVSKTCERYSFGCCVVSGLSVYHVSGTGFSILTESLLSYALNRPPEDLYLMSGLLFWNALLLHMIRTGCPLHINISFNWQPARPTVKNHARYAKLGLPDDRQLQRKTPSSPAQLA